MQGCRVQGTGFRVAPFILFYFKAGTLLVQGVLSGMEKTMEATVVFRYCVLGSGFRASRSTVLGF